MAEIEPTAVESDPIKEANSERTLPLTRLRCALGDYTPRMNTEQESNLSNSNNQERGE